MKIGEKIFYNGKEHLIVKVNEKSVYITEDFDFLSKWEKNKKIDTWKSFCEKNKAFMINTNKMSKGNLTKAEENILKEYFEKAEKKKEKTNVGFPIETAKKTLMVMSFNLENKIIFVKNVDEGSFFFFNVKTGECIPFEKKQKFEWPRAA